MLFSPMSSFLCKVINDKTVCKFYVHIRILFNTKAWWIKIQNHASNKNNYCKFKPPQKKSIPFCYLSPLAFTLEHFFPVKERPSSSEPIFCVNLLCSLLHRLPFVHHSLSLCGSASRTTRDQPMARHNKGIEWAPNWHFIIIKFPKGRSGSTQACHCAHSVQQELLF